MGKRVFDTLVYLRNWREARKAAGLCRRCDDAALLGCVECHACQVKRRLPVHVKTDRRQARMFLNYVKWLAEREQREERAMMAAAARKQRLAMRDAEERSAVVVNRNARMLELAAIVARKKPVASVAVERISARAGAR
jgi:hypothetical protein